MSVAQISSSSVKKPKVARKHIIAAIEAGRLLFFPKYAIKAFPYTGKDKKIGEFGWTISVLPKVK